MKNKYIMTINILFIVICFTALFELYFTNQGLKTQISEIEKDYQELRVQKANDNYMETKMLKLSFIKETFKWLKDIEETDKITLENYNGDTLDIKESTSLNKIILQGLYLDNNIIKVDNTISVKLHNDNRLHYTLRYHFKGTINEIVIFDDGTIKYKDSYFDSQILLNMVQSLMPIAYEVSHDKNDALSVMFNSTLATFANYKLSDNYKSNFEEGLTELCDNAVRLRVSAYFINNNMIKAENNIDESYDMWVTKSSGYHEGKQVDMYIFTVNGGEVNHVKLVYNNIEEIYKLKS